MSFRENWGYARPVPKVLFVLIILYAVFSVYVLAWAFDLAPNMTEDEDLMWIGYAIVSFALATLIAAYHLVTMIFRRKRETDHLIHTRGSTAS